MNEIKELRQVVRRGKERRYDSAAAWYTAMDKAIKELEQAIADHYIRLPTDAGGVPFHLGDLTNMGEVYGLHIYPKTGWHVTTEPQMKTYAPTALIHANPDSWERIIEDAQSLGIDGIDPDMGITSDEAEERVRQLIERCKALAGGAR